MRVRTYRYFSCDFETTVYDGQEDTEVWASAMVELGSEDVKIFHSIGETFNYMASIKDNLICYYHNLKFDGTFWLYYLIHDRKMKQALTITDIDTAEYAKSWEMPNNTFITSISDQGQWYRIVIKYRGYMIEFRDSLKLLPFSVKQIGKAFQTKHQKLEMEYKGLRYAGCTITDEEKKYIANDVLVVKEALEVMFSQGHNKLTIGACCMAEYKSIVGKDQYKAWFPDMSIVEIDKALYGESTVDAYIRHSYKGGWCYLVNGKENKIFGRGVTADVNSLYPSMMHSVSGNYYPIGYPTFWSGNFIPDEATINNRYFFVRLKCRFYIKHNKLPFVQIKGTSLYKGTAMLETSDVKGSPFMRMPDGTIRKNIVTLTLTCTDYKLFREHYDVKDFEILDGCYFDTAVGIFDQYINKYRKIKMESKGAMRTLAKLFLNNLYGKMAANTDSSFKYPTLDENGCVEMISIEQYEKKAGYIPVGSAITSYARNFTIRAAQANYYGPDKAGFIYADTDSIHCDLPPEQVKAIKVDDKEFCCWKLESTWDKAIFARQKTYIEHVVQENLQDVDEPYYNVKCAGMPENCKQHYLTEHAGHELEDFHVGLKVHGKLMPKHIRGGTLLVETDYEMRG